MVRIHSKCTAQPWDSLLDVPARLHREESVLLSTFWLNTPCTSEDIQHRDDPTDNKLVQNLKVLTFRWIRLLDKYGLLGEYLNDQKLIFLRCRPSEDPHAASGTLKGFILLDYVHLSIYSPVPPQGPLWMPPANIIGQIISTLRRQEDVNG